MILSTKTNQEDNLSLGTPVMTPIPLMGVGSICTEQWWLAWCTRAYEIFRRTTSFALLCGRYQCYYETPMPKPFFGSQFEILQPYAQDIRIQEKMPVQSPMALRFFKGQVSNSARILHKTPITLEHILNCFCVNTGVLGN